MSKTFLFQAIQFSQIVLIQTIKYALCSIQPIDRTLSGATTPGQGRDESNGNEGVLRIPQSSSITGTSPSDCLVSYTRTLIGVGVLPLCRGTVGVFYSRCILQSVYSFFLFTFRSTSKLIKQTFLKERQKCLHYFTLSPVWGM